MTSTKPATKASTKASTKPATKATAPKRVSEAAYNRAVKSARAASNRAGEANWIIGDAALAVATAYGESRLERFADDIGYKIGTVRNLRTCAANYPPAEVARDLQSHTVYMVFGKLDERFTLIENGNDGQPWTVSAARAYVDGPAVVVDPDGDGDGDGNGAGDAPVDALAQADGEVDRLFGELTKAITAANKIRRAQKMDLYPRVAQPAPQAKDTKPATPAKASTKATALPMLREDGSDPLLDAVAAKLADVTPAKCDAHGVAHKPGSKAAQACADAQASVTVAEPATPAKPAKPAKATKPATPAKATAPKATAPKATAPKATAPKATAQAKPATPAKATARNTSPKASTKATAPATPAKASTRAPRTYRQSDADLIALQAANPALAERIAQRREQGRLATAARVNGR